MPNNPFVHYLFLVAAVSTALFAPVKSSADSGDSPSYMAYVFADSLALRETDEPSLVLQGGGVSIMFVGESSRVGSVCSGIASRLDCDFSAVFTHSRTQLTDQRSDAVSASEIGALLDEQLSVPRDVIWLDYDPSALPSDTSRRIRELVENGAGLVYVGDGGDLDLWDTDDADSGQLDVVNYRDFGSFEARRIGRGFVAVMPPLDSDWEEYRRDDYLFAAANAVLVSSGRVGDLKMRRSLRHAHSLEFEGMHFQSFRIDLEHDADTEPMTVRCRYRSHNGFVVKKTTDRFNVKRGKTFLMIDYPVLPIGEYSFELMIERESGVSIMAGGAFSVESEDRVVSVELWDPYIDENAIIGGMVNFTDEVDEAWAVTLSLVDDHGRILVTEKPELQPKLKSTSFTFMSRNLKGNIAFVETYFYKSRELLQVLKTPVVIKRPYDPGRFTVAVELESGQHVLRPEVLRSLGHAGVNAIGMAYGNGTHVDAFDDARAAANIKARIIPWLNNPYYTNDTDDDDDFIAVVDTLRNTGTPAVIVAPPVFESLHDDGFSAFLSQRYGDIDALNAAWNARYGAFSDIGPGDGPSSGTRVLDESLYRLSRLFQVQKKAHDRIGFSDAGLGVAMSGFPEDVQNEPAFNAFRWKSILSSVITGEPFPGAAFQIRGGGLNCLAVHGDDSFAVLSASPWRALFGGMNGVYWKAPMRGYRHPVTPAFDPSPGLSVVAGAANEIENGIDMLLSGTDRITDTGIGILVDPLANSAEGVGLSSDGYRELRAFLAACTDLAVSPEFVAEEHLGEIWPSEPDAVLFVPASVVMADRTVERITGFAEAGGTVIVGGRSALYDAGLKKRDRGGLDIAAGIASRSDRPEKKTGTVSFSSDAFSVNAGNGTISCDVGIGFTDEVELIARAGDDPAIVRHGCGDGVVYVIAADIAEYREARLFGGGAWLTELIRGIAGKRIMLDRGIDVNVSISGHTAPMCESALYHDDGAWYFGCVFDTAMKGEADARISISGAEATYAVYDMRSREFIGVTDSFDVTAQAGEAYLFALLPYRVRKLDLKVDDSIIKAGKSVGFRAGTVAVDDELVVGRHVLRIEVLGPDGVSRPSFTGTVEAVGGVYSDDLAFAVNDDHGRWTIRVSDVATGRTAERSFMLMPSDVPAR